MAQDRLGLFDTPPHPKDVKLSLAIAGLLFASLFVILPLRDIQLGPVIAFVPAINAIMFVDDLIIAILLYAQATLFRSRALTVLASGYVASSLLLVAHALSFPGAFAADGLIGGDLSTTAWIANFRRLSFPIAVIFYALLKKADSARQSEAERRPARILLGVSTAILVATLGTVWAVEGHNLLPPLFQNPREGIYRTLQLMNVVGIVLTMAGSLLLIRQLRSVLDVWLLVALSGWMAQSILLVPLNLRYSVGWYSLFGMLLASSLIVMVALLAESIRLYSRLALTTAARNREREARLMSIDAVAVAIGHEVSQPLSAVSLNAKAGINWLEREPPNPGKAIDSLRSILDAGGRTFDVIKSIRATFVQESLAQSQFSFNDLILETTSLLDREMAVQKVSLRLALDAELPLILANRTQIQRVLVNLLSNAIESVSATRNRNRRIHIRSAPFEDDHVLLEIRDSGLGIPPEKMAFIFEPFFTTKTSGTGLGLSLCRNIVDEHGGRLWASPGNGHGACFHLKLPNRPSARQ